MNTYPVRRAPYRSITSILGEINSFNVSFSSVLHMYREVCCNLSMIMYICAIKSTLFICLAFTSYSMNNYCPLTHYSNKTFAMFTFLHIEKSNN